MYNIGIWVVSLSWLCIAAFEEKRTKIGVVGNGMETINTDNLI